jgi:N-acetylmuramoyl-L-alanine amidase
MAPLKIHRDRISPNHDARRSDKPVDILLLHYTGMESAAAALDRLRDPVFKVSAHYMIDECGEIWALVPEDRRAWHAGKAFWAGETDINARSIGIELVNPGHEFGYRPFPEAQMVALDALAKDILNRHRIPAERVLGHSDVAPDRKTDPGELFDWRRLSAAGIGLWSDATRAVTGEGVEAFMRRYGYADASTAAIAAFQRHYRPASITGEADDETAARLADLVRRMGTA